MQNLKYLYTPFWPDALITLFIFSFISERPQDKNLFQPKTRDFYELNMLKDDINFFVLHSELIKTI